MFKKIRIILIALIFIGVIGGSNVTLAAEQQVGINDKEVYKITSYRYGDCVLWSNVYMLRRAAILSGSRTWSSITTKALRSYACTSKNGSALKYAYTYEADGIRYSVVHGYLTGSAQKRAKTLKAMLNNHPEGVVLWGSSSTGVHGVLVTSYTNGAFRAADSTHNQAGANRGIEKFANTTMHSVGGCSHYWYLEKQSGVSTSRIKNAKVGDLTLTQEESTDYVLSWKLDDKTAPIDGYVVYTVPVDQYSDDDDYEVYAKTDEKELKIKNLQDGKKYYFKVRGYYTRGGKRIYTRYSRITVKMDKQSEPIPVG